MGEATYGARQGLREIKEGGGGMRKVESCERGGSKMAMVGAS